ncbi:MAG: protein-tyrosine-phosphatase, partial [Bacteroidota bacterium]
AAIMTCSEADAECPIVFGADSRIKLFYEDPKVSDGTSEEASTYDERCKQIAAEMYYAFSSLG